MYDLIVTRRIPEQPYVDCSVCWLVDDDNEAVGYALVGFTPQDELTVLEIEVRPGWRRQGLSKVLIAAIEEHFGSALHTNGDLTRDGAEWLPEMPHDMFWKNQVSTTPHVPDWVSIFVDYWQAPR